MVYHSSKQSEKDPLTSGGYSSDYYPAQNVSQAYQQSQHHTIGPYFIPTPTVDPRAVSFGDRETSSDETDRGDWGQTIPVTGIYQSGPQYDSTGTYYYGNSYEHNTGSTSGTGSGYSHHPASHANYPPFLAMYNQDTEILPSSNGLPVAGSNGIGISVPVPQTPSSQPRYRGIPKGCQLCPKSFASQKDLTRHENTVHWEIMRNERDIDDFLCPVRSCKHSVRRFSRRDNLIRHCLNKHGFILSSPSPSMTSSEINVDFG